MVQLFRSTWLGLSVLRNRVTTTRQFTTSQINLASSGKSSDVIDSTKIDDSLGKSKTDSKSRELVKFEFPNENPLIPKEHVFQELVNVNTIEPILTLEQAAQPDHTGYATVMFRYPKLISQNRDYEYSLRSNENEYSIIHRFPEVTDFLIVGSGLLGSATAYYLKYKISRTGDVVVMDHDPYSTHNCTAICNGLISSQSKSREISRLASLTNELIRNLRRDVLVTEEDYAKIKYQPCTHLILWNERDVEDIMRATEIQIEDGCFTETKLPHELESTFPWLKVQDSDVALGTHGSQSEAIVDPIALRNLYRTLAQAHGVNFVRAEAIDFNTMTYKEVQTLVPLSAGAIVARMPSTGELRSIGASKIILTNGLNLPFLESRSEMEPYMRDMFQDLHFIQPRLRVHFVFTSLNSPVIHFPVITDTDGSMLMRDEFIGSFKYYLTHDESEYFIDKDYDRFISLEDDQPYPNLIHKDEMFRVYFNEVVKPRLVKRIPAMGDATFELAYSGFESNNTHDGCPIVGPHPFHNTVSLGGGFGSRLMTLAPASAVCLTELALYDEERTIDVNNLYWNRIIANRMVDEFKNLVR